MPLVIGDWPRSGKLGLGLTNCELGRVLAGSDVIGGDTEVPVVAPRFVSETKRKFRQ